TAHRLLDVLPGGDVRGGDLEALEMPGDRTQDRDRRGVFGEGAVEGEEELRDLAAADRIGHVVERQGGAVADGRDRVGELGPAAGADIQHQLGELAAGDDAVVAEVGQQEL